MKEKYDTNDWLMTSTLIPGIIPIPKRGSYYQYGTDFSVHKNYEENI